ncbi:porin PorA family protein [Nocardia neocaledoniensis]|uniref:porin PorA family protein n=1 Tax=Nocardia neocaledoniensis TaxID=236511 RepID=UPI002453BE47|nr:porin PorA family protein [Nocardia neocaledoniensis]
MTVRKSSVVWLALGVVLIAAAAIIRFVALPALTKLPADLDQSQKYEGTLQTIDPKAFAANDLAHLLSPEVPITADRSLTVDTVSGDTAIVTSKALLSLPDGTTQPDVHTYAVSRIDYSPVAISETQEKSLVPADNRSFFEAHKGLAFSWPMDPPKDGTALYDPVTRTAQPATFQNEGTLEGRHVYNYKIDAAGPLASPAVLSQFKDFPKQLPKAAIAGLLQAEIVPEQFRATLTAALPTMPDLVTIGFGSTNVIDAAVDSQFGAPLKVHQTQGIYVTVPADGREVPTIPLSIAKLHTADSAVTDTAHTLSKNATMLSLLGVWLPIVLLAVGIVLAAVAVLRWRTPVSATSAQ